jgi:hypothetical protein
MQYLYERKTLNMNKNSYIKPIFTAWVNFTPKASALRHTDIHNRSGDIRSMKTEDGVLYSYDTPILWKSQDGRVTLNTTRYSATTNRQVSVIRQMLAEAGISYTEVSGLDRGFTISQGV